MRVKDELFLQLPFLGTRQMRSRLRRLGYEGVGRKRIRRLMRFMVLRAVYQRLRTSVSHPVHPTSPYLLRHREIARSNQVSCADITYKGITYIPMERDFMHLLAVMDWHGRKILFWRLSNALDSDFCVAALDDALSRYGAPEICNTEQGCQFTSVGFIILLQENNIRISMDGRNCWRDIITVERLWGSLKYENIYLHAYESGSDTRRGMKTWIDDYYQNRKKKSLADIPRNVQGPLIAGRVGPTARKNEDSLTKKSLPCCSCITAPLSGISGVQPGVAVIFNRGMKFIKPGRNSTIFALSHTAIVKTHIFALPNTTQGFAQSRLWQNVAN